MSHSIRSYLHQRKEGKRNALLPLIVLGLALLLTLRVSATEKDASPQMLYPGGIPFGIRFTTDGVMIVGFSDVTENGKTYSPARDAGICEGDRITRCNGIPLSSVEDLTNAIEGSCGKSVTFEVARGSETLTATVTPRLSDADGRYKSGVRIRDSGAGIGTVTFVSPDGHLFAGLGHGICQGERSELVPMSRGTIFSVKVSDVIIGKAGAPGELKGRFTEEKLGSLLGNTELGMFGALTGLPDAMANDPRCRLIEIGTRNEISEGKATIYSTLDENGLDEYEIEISDIRRDATRGKCFSVKVTDERLLKKSGGIVQGMSGSPIIQNGKLVGAVTHVLINDPTSGYGIFVENMLNAAPAKMVA